MRDRGGKKNLTVAQQYLLLRSNPNSEGAGSLKRGMLNWHFKAQPTPMSRNYTIRLEYTADSSPDVYVEDPDITYLADGHDLPHVYHNPLRLCLYMPSTGQWQRTKRIDQTIVPWTYVWLFYFEDWLTFGEWNGGGKHPGD